MSLSCSLFTTCGRDLGSLCYHPLLVCLLRLLNDCWADIGSQEPRSSRSSFKAIAPLAGNTQWKAERERNRFALSFQVEEVVPEGLELLHGVLPFQHSFSASSFGNLFSLWLSVVKAHLIEFKKKKKEKKTFTLDRRWYPSEQEQKNTAEEKRMVFSGNSKRLTVVIKSLP